MKRRKLLIGLLTFMFAAGSLILTSSVTYAQTALGLNWTSLGPDNYSGRTRALLLSNKDPQYKTLYAGGVSGGLWKSTTNGLTWSQIKTDDVVLNVSCIAQAPNGDIYVGTGENFSSERFNLFSGFIGQGIYKSTDGNTFTKLTATDPGSFNNPDAEWAFINKLAAGDNNKVYAATNGGLKVSTDGGQTWALAQAGSTDLNQVSSEVNIASDGTVIASVGNKVYLSIDGAKNNFVLISGQAGENELPQDGLSRIVLAFAPSDASTIYAVLIADGTNTSYLKGQLVGVYVSKDKGEKWRLVGPGASVIFNVFGNPSNTTHYGDYVASMVVDKTNPDKVYVGGINVWEGIKILETGYYQWQQKSAGNVTRFHNIIFDPAKPYSAYVSTDDGIYYSTDDLYSFSPLNRDYRTSMFYTVAYDDKGHVLGGTQGNGVIFIDGKGNTPEAGKQIYGGNVGGSVEMSMINPTAMFYSSTGGLMERSADLGVSIANEFANDAISGSNPGVFQTPFRMWESFNNTVSLDSISYIAKENLASGTVLDIKSKTGGFPFNYTLSEDLSKGDSVRIQDIISSRFFLGVTNAVYMTKEVLEFGKRPQWFKIANIDGVPSAVAYSSDANYLFVGTQTGKVYRIANIALANDSIRADVGSPAAIISTSLINDFAGRLVTSISVDQQNSSRVIVTLGNYGSNDFVYLTTNSLDQTPVFNSVQGNLPKMPVYASLFEASTSNVLIGTDFGIYTTKSIGANTSWTAENNGMGALPIMSIRQQTMTRPIIPGYPGITNTGAIYIASHGNGIFENKLYVGLERPEIIGAKSTELLNIYPNPVNNQLNFNIEVSKAGSAVINIYDLKGNIQNVTSLGSLNKGNNKVSLNVNYLTPGTYLLQITVGNEMQRAKFVVVK